MDRPIMNKTQRVASAASKIARRRGSAGITRNEVAWELFGDDVTEAERRLVSRGVALAVKVGLLVYRGRFNDGTASRPRDVFVSVTHA